MKRPLSLILLVSFWGSTAAAAFLAGRHFFPAPTTERPGVSGLVAPSGGRQFSPGPSVRPKWPAISAPGRPVASSGEAADNRGVTAPVDVAVTLKSVMEQKNPVARMQGFLDVLAGLGPGEMPDAVTVLKDMGGSSGKELSLMLHQWAQMDPASAAGWLSESDDGRFKGWAGRLVMEDWAQRDPLAATAMAETLGKTIKEGENNPWLSGVIRGLAENDPRSAGVLTQKLSYGEERGDAVEQVVDSFFTSDPGGDAAREWAESLPDTDPRLKAGVTARVADALAKSSPEKAAEWVADLPEGSRSRAMASVAGRWASKDPNAAGTWLDSIPASPERNEAVVNFAWTVRREDPEAAMIWAGTITEEEQRNETTYRLAREWVREDPESAKAWVGQSALPENLRQRLLDR